MNNKKYIFSLRSINLEKFIILILRFWSFLEYNNEEIHIT
jgi:hypothetical protein